MSEDSDFEAPRATEPWAPAWELCAWAALLFACTAPLQVLLDRDARPGTSLLTAAAAVGAVALLFTRGRPGSAFRLAVAAWPYLLVIALTGAFALGAIDPHWSMVRWVTWSPCVIVAFCAAARLSGTQLTTTVLALLAGAAAASAIVALAAPSLGVMGGSAAHVGEGSNGAWAGVYRTKNALGHTAAIAFALLAVFGKRALGWGLALVGVVAATACLIMARSASGIAIAALLTGFCLFVLNGRGLTRIMALGLFTVAGALLAVGGEAATTAIAGALGRDATLSGRTAIWSAAAPYAMQQPLTGSGFDYTGSPEVAERLRGLFDVYSVHSAYLDALITLGFPLSVLLVFAIGFALLRAWRTPVWPGDDHRAIATALLVGGLLSAVTEAGITHPSGPMQMLWLLALFGLYARA